MVPISGMNEIKIKSNGFEENTQYQHPINLMNNFNLDIYD